MWPSQKPKQVGTPEHDSATIILSRGTKDLRPSGTSDSCSSPRLMGPIWIDFTTPLMSTVSGDLPGPLLKALFGEELMETLLEKDGKGRCRCRRPEGSCCRSSSAALLQQLLWAELPRGDRRGRFHFGTHSRHRWSRHARHTGRSTRRTVR